ncbi:MAG: hypothetical protein LUE64_00080 [Candidatus Gastranaerophilales bacterium]|nr:hypothetical protein [Candidatus Gastranaerophilales bacterium]
MTTVSTLQTNSNTYTYDEFVQLVQSGAVDTSDLDSVSVFEASTDSSQCTDGEDDGKIGIGSALLNIGKGVVSGAVNIVKGAFTDEDGNFSLKQTLKTAGITALCFVPVVGQFVAAGLCAYGCVTGAVGIANGVYQAATADTDAEAKEAFQSIGTSGLTLGLSAYGASKVGSSLAKQYGSGVSSEATLTENISTVGKNIGQGFSDYYGSAWETGTAGKTGISKIASGTKSVLGEAAEGTVHNIANTASAVKEKVSEKYNKATGKTGTVESVPENATQVSDNTYKVETTENGKTTTKTYKLNSEGKWDYTTETSTTTSVTDKNTGNTTETVKNSDGSSTKITTDKSGNVVEKTITNADGSSVKTTTDSLGNTTEVKTMADGSTQTTVRDSYGYEISSSSTTSSGGSTTTTTDFNSTKLAKEYNLTTDQVTTLKNGGTVTTKNGTTLTTTAADDMASVTIKTKASTVGKATSAVSDWFSNAASTEYTSTSGLSTTTGTATTTEAALAVGSKITGDATIDSMEDISEASTTYVTTSGTTGVEYTLQDYSLPTEEEVDKTYAEIYGSVL